MTTLHPTPEDPRGPWPMLCDGCGRQVPLEVAASQTGALGVYGPVCCECGASTDRLIRAICILARLDFECERCGRDHVPDDPCPLTNIREGREAS